MRTDIRTVLLLNSMQSFKFFNVILKKVTFSKLLTCNIKSKEEPVVVVYYVIEENRRKKPESKSNDQDFKFEWYFLQLLKLLMEFKKLSKMLQK